MRTLLVAPLLAALLIVTAASPAAAVETEITSGPDNGALLLPGPVTYTFTANEGGYSFECSVDASAFASCQSPVTYDLPPGTHVLKVRYVGLGTDPTPAERIWTIRNVPCEQAGAAHQAATSDFFKWHTRKGYKKEALQRAKDAGNDEKVKRLKKKIKQLNKRIKRAQAAIDAAAAQEQAVC